MSTTRQRQALVGLAVSPPAARLALALAASASFSADPVVATPDVTELRLREGEDEFLIVASDGLWDYMPAGEAVRWARNEFKRGCGARLLFHHA